jgi:hypothetical protein
VLYVNGLSIGAIEILWVFHRYSPSAIQKLVVGLKLEMLMCYAMFFFSFLFFFWIKCSGFSVVVVLLFYSCYVRYYQKKKSNIYIFFLGWANYLPTAYRLLTKSNRTAIDRLPTLLTNFWFGSRNKILFRKPVQ